MAVIYTQKAGLAHFITKKYVSVRVFIVLEVLLSKDPDE